MLILEIVVPMIEDILITITHSYFGNKGHMPYLPLHDVGRRYV